MILDWRKSRGPLLLGLLAIGAVIWLRMAAGGMPAAPHDGAAGPGFPPGVTPGAGGETDPPSWARGEGTDLPEGISLETAGATGRPAAVGRFLPSPLAPDIRGTIEFYPAAGGTHIVVSVEGLPPYAPGEPPVGPHGFHIHESGTCEVGDPDDPFLSAGSHWNPDGQPHGHHAGDFPVLFSDGGKATLSFTTGRFQPADVIGLGVIIHENPDDYRSQPTGASGRRLTCAIIVAP